MYVVILVFIKIRGYSMRISYKKLWIMLAEKEMSKQDFREKLGIASGTMTKLNKGQEVSMSVILRICEYFDCNICDVCDAVKTE
jgi:DNA-binding Xre family transcriptional regulator